MSDGLKAGGWDPASISNRRKCELGERLRRATGLPLRSITGFLRISKSSYEYHRARLGRPDRDADIRGLVASTFEEGRGAWGYRVVHARLRRAGVVASEKRVLRVMREKGLRPAYDRDWRGVGFGEFAERLDAYLRYYCEGRIKESLGWLSPDEYRRKLGYAS